MPLGRPGYCLLLPILGAPGPRRLSVEATPGPGPAARVRRRRATRRGCPCSAPTTGALRSDTFGMRPGSQLAGVPRAAGRPRRGFAVARAVWGSRLGSPQERSGVLPCVTPRATGSGCCLLFRPLLPVARGVAPVTLGPLVPPTGGALGSLAAACSPALPCGGSYWPPRRGSHRHTKWALRPGPATPDGHTCEPLRSRISSR